MTNEAKLISFIVQGIVTGDKKKDIEYLITASKIDWEVFRTLVIYHELIPFTYIILKDLDSLVPQSLISFLKKDYYYNLFHCQSLWQEFLEILDAFKDAGVTILPLKGVALLKDLYSHNQVRPMADIDLLIEEKDMDMAEKIFDCLRYRKELHGLKEEYWKKNQYHITFYHNTQKKKEVVELHWGIDYKRKRRNILLEFWSRIREIRVENRIVKILSPEDTLFSLAVHSRRFGRVLSLKNVFDAVLLLDKYKDSFDWDYCLYQAKKYEICSALFFMLYQVGLLSGVTPKYVRKGLNLQPWKRRIAQHFIENNIFEPHQRTQLKNLYLKSHFLLYDNLWEPIDYIFNIPQEQFAKFYGLKPYDRKTDFLYKNRLFYILYKSIIL